MSQATEPEDIEGQAAALVARAYQLADSQLEGINEAAEELAGMSRADLTVISRARRVVMGRLATRPDRATAQVAWLIRRAIEVGAGQWQWETTDPVP